MNRTRQAGPLLAAALLAAGLAAMVALVTPCAAYDPLTWSSVDGGGVMGAVSGAYQLSATIGQHDAGSHSGGSFELRAGFWRPAAAPTPHTYVWSAPSGAWNSPSSWTPPRNTPAPEDTLIFDGNVMPTVTVSDIVPDTFRRLHIKGNCDLTILNDNSSDTLKVTGNAGDDFLIAADSRLWLLGGLGNSIRIAMASGATGRVAGELWASNGPQRLLPSDAGALVFESNSNCRAMDGLVGSLFGDTGAPDAVVFESGSCYHQGGGSVPFGLPPPASRIVLQPGSLYRHLELAPGDAFNGRTYADCEINLPDSLDIYAETMMFGGRIDDLVILRGGVKLIASPSDSSLDILGDALVFPQGTLEAGTAGSGVARVRFAGSGIQTFNVIGNVVLGASSELEVANPVGLTLSSGLASSGSVKLTGSRMITFSHALHLGVTGTVTGPFWVDGNIAQDFPASAGTVTRNLRVGDSNRAAPVTLAFASIADTGTVVVRTDFDDHPDLAESTLDPARSANRWWTVSNLGVAFSTCDATFGFDPADVDGGADPDLFFVARHEGGAWTMPAAGARTATSTQALALGSFGEFAVGEPEAPLAVGDAIPAVTGLSAARPSPFRTNTTLDFSLARPGVIELSIFDVTGRRVRTLERGTREAGAYHVLWDGRDDARAGVRAGAYFARLVTPDGSFLRRLVRVP